MEPNKLCFCRYCFLFYAFRFHRPVLVSGSVYRYSAAVIWCLDIAQCQVPSSTKGTVGGRDRKILWGYMYDTYGDSGDDDDDDDEDDDDDDDDDDR